MKAAICPKRGCGSTLITVPISGAIECPGCNRHALGLCRDCDGRVPTTHHRRCTACAHRRALDLELARALRRYRKNENGYRDRQLARKQRQLEDPVFRAADLERRRQRNAAKLRRPKTRAEIAADRAYHRAWRLAHPKPQDKRVRDRQRAKERYQTDPVHRAKVLERNRLRGRLYRARKLEEIRARDAAKKREMWKNPEFRARQNALRRERQARQRHGQQQQEAA